MMKATAVPRFYLYGEPHRTVDTRFAHVEDLDDRSRPSEWTIHPHAHAELNHIFYMETGGGAMRADQNYLTFDAPCLIIVPAGLVHGFTWHRESVGAVVTLSTSYLLHLVKCDDALRPLFGAADVCTMDAAESALFGRSTNDLKAELGWCAPGYRAAAEAGLLKLLVQALRLVGARNPLHHHFPGHQVALVARLRERVENRFRLREPIAHYAKALGTSPTRLRAACATVAGQSPMAILDQRAILEARRALLYSNLSIAEVGASLGFNDPLYFSRYFTRHAGMAPRAYRATNIPVTGLDCSETILGKWDF